MQLENKNKMEFNKDNMNEIIREYLGISNECLKYFDIAELEHNITTIIDKYINDKRDIGYILESDIMYASDNEEDIQVLEMINGIAVYENLINMESEEE